MHAHIPLFRMRRLARVLAACVLSGSLAGHAPIAAAIGAEDTGYLDLSLEELLEVIVTSVSKKSQKLGQTAAAVHVIGAEDIRRSGATTLPEVLRLAPGVQVSAISHNKWSVSIRGFPGRYSNKLLVLVDGRSIYSPLFSGVFWEFHDIPLDNIERIEVIRGPGGSIWGANAVNGVINIITRSARDTQGGAASLAVGDEKTFTGYFRHGWMPDEDTRVRVHAQFREVDASKDWATGADGRDDWRSGQVGFRLDKTLRSGSLSVQGNLYDSQAGDAVTAYDFAGSLPPAFVTSGNNGKGGHLLARWESTESGGARQSLQGYLEYGELDYSGLADERRATVDIEYQRQLRLGEAHDIVWGVGYRVSRDRQIDTPYVSFDPDKRTTDLWSAYLQDEIALVPDRWRLTLGGRVEHNDYSGVEFQPNARIAWTPDAQDVYWAAVSRGVRTPSRGEANSRAALSPPMPLILLSVGDPDIGSEKMNALDVGWRRQWESDLSTDISAFYYRYTDLRGTVMGMPTPPYLPLSLTNVSNASVRGLEFAVDWRATPVWRLKAGYSFASVSEEDRPGSLGGMSELTGTTPKHQFTLFSTYDVSPNLQWDVLMRHVSELNIQAISGEIVVPAHTVLDMRLGWRAWKDFSLSLVGQNLLDARHIEFVDSHIASAPTEVERGIYLKLHWKF